uniref:Zinc finger CCCH-type TRM13 domain-containing protein n=1 Tax=Nothobranchius furzeri TaxID=105023 RepID=A0A8C6M1R6_NOTFU
MAATLTSSSGRVRLASCSQELLQQLAQFNMAEPTRCVFFLQKKKRFCKMIVAKGRRFCGEHATMVSVEFLIFVRQIPLPPLRSAPLRSAPTRTPEQNRSRCSQSEQFHYCGRAPAVRRPLFRRPAKIESILFSPDAGVVPFIDSLPKNDQPPRDHARLG